MRIIRKREHVVKKTYARRFEWRDRPGAGFSFECDADGNVFLPRPSEAAQSNYTRCLDGTYDVRDEGVVEYVDRYTIPAAGECVRCGETVELHGFTNTCECGADYNMSGQLLAHRSQWGEETGESLSDILSIP